MSERADESALTNRSKTVYCLQWLRALAAALVLIRHTSVHYATENGGYVFGVGQIGVDVFFVISGVVIYLTGRNLSWHVFARRRIARIIPLYWLVTIPAVLATLSHMNNPYWLPNAVLSFLFIPAHDSPTTIWPPVMAGWTLNYEMYFYAVCAVALLTLPKRLFLVGVTGMILAGILVGGPFVWSEGARVVPAVLILLMPISVEFLAGMWIGHLWSKGVRTPAWFNLLLAAIALAMVFQFVDSHPYRLWRPFYWGPPAAILVWVMLVHEDKFPFHRWKTPLLLGDSSYALYLIHPVVLSIEFAIIKRLDLQIAAPVAFPLILLSCFVASVIVHKLVELPAVRLASRALGLAPRSTAATSLNSADGASAAKA